MKTLYLDIFSGISGDMLVGALIDLGVDAARLEHEIARLGVRGYHLHVRKGSKASIAGTKFDVHLEHEHTHATAGEGSHQHAHGHHHHHDHDHPHSHEDEPEHDHDDEHDHDHDHDHEHEHEHEHAHHHEHGHEHGEHEHHGRDFAAIKKLISESALSPWVKQKAIAVFHRIAVAEGKIHGLPPDQVHFHEVGAVDSIVDIVGACIALELLGKPRVLSAPVVEGTGFIRCAHGRFPIPAPATLAILGERGVPVTQCDEPHELVTPTGAALLAELAEGFGPMQGLVAQKIGFGLGTRDNQTRPNVLRAILGEAAGAAGGHDWQRDTIAVLETNLDDVNSEILGHFVDKALAAGALDVFYTPIQMKKNRPGALLTVLCDDGEADRFTELILRETSSFGVRRAAADRRKLGREMISVETDYGPIQVKLGRLDGKIIQAAPEYESCRAAAEKNGVPLKTVYAAVIRSIRA